MKCCLPLLNSFEPQGERHSNSFGATKMMKWGYLLIAYLLEKHIIHTRSNNEVPTLLCAQEFIAAIVGRNVI